MSYLLLLLGGAALFCWIDNTLSDDDANARTPDDTDERDLPDDDPTDRAGDGDILDDQPVGGSPDDNTPGSDTPGSDTPRNDTPGSDTPGNDTPGSDTPGNDTPGSDTPGNDTPGSDTPGSDTPDDDLSDDDTDDTLPVTAFNPNFGSWPPGVFFQRSEPGDPSTRFLLNISDEPQNSIVLEGGILEMDSEQFDPDAFNSQIFEYDAAEGGSPLERLALRSDGALVLQHPDADDPLIVEGADFDRLIGDIDVFDLRAAQTPLVLSPSEGTVVFGGDGALELSIRGETTVVLGSGDAVLLGLEPSETNDIFTGEGRVVMTSAPGDTITPAAGTLFNGALELRVAEGVPANGPTVINGFDVTQSQILLFEPADPFGPDTPAPISLVDSAAGLQVFSGERLVALLPGVTQADNPEITSETERWGGSDPRSFL